MNNARQPWHSTEGRLQYGLRPANPTEEGLASLHSVLFRKQPFLWRAALLYYTIHQAAHMSFRQLFQDLAQYVKDEAVRWEYCVRAKRGQMDTSQPGGGSGVRGRPRLVQNKEWLWGKDWSSFSQAASARTKCTWMALYASCGTVRPSISHC